MRLLLSKPLFYYPVDNPSSLHLSIGLQVPLYTEHLTQLGSMGVLSTVQALHIIARCLEAGMPKFRPDIRERCSSLFHAHSERMTCGVNLGGAKSLQADITHSLNAHSASVVIFCQRDEYGYIFG
jgi:hypothetical protein